MNMLPTSHPSPCSLFHLASCPSPLCSLLILSQSLSLEDSVRRSNVTSLEEFPLFFLFPVPPTAVYSYLYHTTPHFALPVKRSQLSIPSASPSWAGTLSDHLYIFSTWHVTGLPSRFISELKPVGIQAGMDKLCLQSPLINYSGLT